MAEKLKISGNRSHWEDAWSKVRLGDTVIAAQPGFDPVKFVVTVRAGGDGYAPLQICGEGTLLYGAPWPLEIIAGAGAAKGK